MKTKQRSEMKIETHEVTVVRVRSAQSREFRCAECGETGTHVTVPRAAALIGFSEFAIFRLAEGKSIHSVEDVTGKLWLCSNSLVPYLKIIDLTR